MSRLLNPEELTRQVADLPEWRIAGQSLSRSYKFPNFLSAITAVDQIAVEAETMNHHPDIDIRWRNLLITLSTHSEGGITQLDIELAHQMERIAGALGAS